MTIQQDMPYRLRLPGPTSVPERIAQAMTVPILNHRGPEFKAIFKETASLIRPILGTSNQPMFFACSGTGMMEAALANVLVPGDEVLVLNCGQFAERFMRIAEALGLEVSTLDAPWGEAIESAAIAQRLGEGDFRAVIAVHNESSTGAVADLAAIGAIVRDTRAVFIVDSVSGLGGVEMRQDEWGVDVVVSASQKALMCPPGIGMASVSDKAWKMIDDGRARPRFYWDLSKARAMAEDDQTVFTPPVSLIIGICEALRMIHEEGIANVLTRHQRVANELQTGGADLGLSVFTKAPITSNTVTVFNMPEGLDGSDVIRHMYEHYNTVIAGARFKLKGRVIRIGTMGACGSEDVRQDLEYLKLTFDALR